MINKLLYILAANRFDLHNEKMCQQQINDELKDHSIEFSREFQLDSKNIPDFYLKNEGIAVEVKIKGNARQIFRQLERYATFENVNSLILVTNRSMGLPPTIKDKPCYMIHLGKAWL